MQTAIYDKNGKVSTEKVNLDDKVFAAKINSELMTQAVYVYLSNQRQSNAHTKTRADVSGGGKKPWKQKGTGKARHGSNRSPIWRGGGITFGPRNDKNYKKSLSKKMIKASIRSAFSFKMSEKSIFVLNDLEPTKTKMTQSIIKVLGNAKIEGKTLIVQDKKNQAVVNSVNNLKNINITVVNELNTYTLLNYKNIVVLKDALVTISDFWGVKESKIVKKSEKEVKEMKEVKVSTKKVVKAKK